MRKVLGLVVAGGIIATMTACSTVSPEADQRALHYKAGSFSSKEFQGCVDARQTNGPGDQYYIYPTSQRSFTASDAEGADAPAFTIVSADNVELKAPISVTFDVNTSCEPIKVDGKNYPGGVLQLFHERLANRYKAYWTPDMDGDANSDGVPDGWPTLLNFAIGNPIDAQYDRAAQGYKWRQLWNDPATKTKIEQDLTQSLQTAVDSRMGAPAGQKFFQNFKVTLTKPTPTNDDLVSAVSSEQANVSKAESAEKQAKADKLAAEAQIAVAKAKAAGLREEIDALGADVWLKKYAIDNDISPWPNPVVAGQAAK